MKLLILDIEETLVYATAEQLERRPDFTMEGYSVYLKPHVHESLDYAYANFRVGIWTSSIEDYARKTLESLLKGREVEFFWLRERCTRWLNQ